MLVPFIAVSTSLNKTENLLVWQCSVIDSKASQGNVLRLVQVLSKYSIEAVRVFAQIQHILSSQC